MEYLVVDGYNVINSWSDKFDLEKESLEDCRIKLLNILSNYQGFKKTSIIAVFDAHMVKGSQEVEEDFDNVKVVFTKENETADNYIEKFVYKWGNVHTIRVVTSDYLEQRMILSSGGIRMSPRELTEEINKANESMKSRSREKYTRTNSIMSNIEPELLEKLEKMRRGKF